MIFEQIHEHIHEDGYGEVKVVLRVGTSREGILDKAGEILTISLGVGGTGYTAADVITIVQTGGSLGTVTVNTVDGAGVILTCTLLAGGSGYTVANSLAVTGGTGTGATINILTVKNIHTTYCLNTKSVKNRYEIKSGQLSEDTFDIELNEAAMTIDEYHLVDTSGLTNAYTTGLKVNNVKAITAITRAAEAVFTSVAHGYTIDNTGDIIQITGDASDDEWNELLANKNASTTSGRLFSLVYVSADTFKLQEDVSLFIQDAQDITMERFVGLFCLAQAGSISIDNNLYLGMLNPEMSADDLMWYDAEWGVTPTPLRNWKIIAKPSGVALLDEIPFEDIVTAIEADSTWKTINVFARPGYWQHDYGAPYTYRYYEMFVDRLVNLTTLIEKMLTEASVVKPAFTFDLQESELHPVFRPTRYPKLEYPTANPVPVPYLSFETPVGNHNLPDVEMRKYPTDDADAKLLKIGSADQGLSLFVQYGLIAEGANEISPQQTDQFRWVNITGIESLADLLYYLALNLGCFLSITQTTTTNVDIEFISRNNYAIDVQTYVKDIQSPKIKLSITTDKTEGNYYGVGNYLEAEGNQEYRMIFDQNKYESRSIYGKLGTEGKPLLVSISPLLRWVHSFKDTDEVKEQPSGIRYFTAQPYHSHYFPHNTILSVNSVLQTEGFNNARDFHGGLYMKVSPYAGMGTGEPVAEYWTTVGIIETEENDGTQSVSTKLEYYLNDLMIRDNGFYKTEYELDIPYIMGFSANSDGSSPDWSALALRNHIYIDGVKYLVVEIERDFENWKTKIKLHHSDRFSFGTISTVTAHTSEEEPATEYSAEITNVYSEETTNDDLIVGDYVTLKRTDGKVEKTEAKQAHYKKIYGIAQSAASAGDGVTILTDGRAYIPDHANMTIGNRIFINTDGSYNFSETALTEKDGDLDLFAEVGLVVGAKYVEVNWAEQHILT